MAKTAAETTKTAPKKTTSKPVAAKKTAPKPAPKAAPAVEVKKVVKQKEAKDKEVAVAKEKTKKANLVRDSFTMPEAEYKLIGDVKRDCLQAGIEVKKSELLRVGVALVRQMDIAKLKAAITALPELKAGRPKKEK